MTEHGKANTYLRGGCRCEPCTLAAARARKRYRMSKARGQAGWVDSAAVVAHVERLRAQGYSLAAIARAAGYPKVQGLHNVLSSSRRVTRRTAERVLSVTPTMVRNGWVPALGTRRRLQALARAGWSGNVIAAAVGLDATQLRDIRYGRIDTVRRTTADAVAAFYAEHEHLQGPAKNTATVAARHGWPPPAAWEEHELDNPRANVSRRVRVAS